MRFLLIACFFLLPLHALTPERVIVLYNEDSPDSVSLANYYQEKRGIPKEHLISLSCEPKAGISQADFQNKIITPLTAELSQRKLWSLDRNGEVSSKKFDVIVTTYGLPYRIGGSMIPATVDAKGNPVKARKRRPKEQDGASLDSELTLIGQKPYQKLSMVKNPFFRSPLSYDKTPFPGMILVGRIDGPNLKTCKRMIYDAIAVEKTGLYGKAYLDLAKRTAGYAEGENWIRDIYSHNIKLGIPSVLDRNKDVFVTNYPLIDAAVYFGWYKKNCAGAFRNSELELKQGGIAVHIHSFSARNIRDPKKHWAGSLLAKGAAVTLGNVMEPFLQFTTHLDLFYENLTEGKTVIESAWHATPALSWHNVILGDPLYRPFKNRKPANKIDQKYEFLRSNAPHTAPENQEIIALEAFANNSALYNEVIGLSSMDSPECLASFQQAFDNAESPNEILANALHQIRYHREQGDKPTVLKTIQTYRELFKETPQELPLIALKNIIDPPPPPPVETPKQPVK